MDYAVVFVSKAVRPEQPHNQVRELRQCCAPLLAAAGVQSAFLMQDGMFCQWIQGDIQGVESVLVHIRADARHSELMILFRGLAAPCLFDTWCMGIRSLYMAQGDAFQRAELLHFRAREKPYPNPYEAWMAFAGITSTSPSGNVGEPITLLGQRSSSGAQLILAEAKRRQADVAITRWAASADRDCDLQTVGGVLPLGSSSAYVASISTRCLRVGAVREAVRNRKRWVILLPNDDMGELDHLLASVDWYLPSSFVPQSVTIIAPNWAEESRSLAQRMLASRAWQGQTHALDVNKRGAWTKLGELVPA